MILDAYDSKVNLHWGVRFAIIGAGPAGMTIARKLADLGPILLLESGGFELDPASQALYEGESVGINYSLTDSRSRQFGGTSNLWAGWCATFDPHDFEARDWLPESGWPFGPNAIEPYYKEAAEILNLGELNFDARDIITKAELTLPFDDKLIVPSVWRFGTPVLQCGKHLREEFELSSEIITILHANVVDIALNSDHSRVEGLTIRTLDGREGRVNADVVVLACGGIETPRILLNANTQIRHGIGNASDMVGRFFQEHPHKEVSSLHLVTTDWFRCSLERTAYGHNLYFMLALGLGREIQEEYKLLNARAHIYRSPSIDDDRLRVGLFMEQAPNRNSRITLTQQRDALGMRRARLDWQLTELDLNTYEETGKHLSREFERYHLGSTLPESSQVTRRMLPPIPTNHHIGTTRMARDSDVGVVNTDCRVHDLENLYIAGSSVFPTSSWANPTFTLIALVLRLADHLRTKYSK